MLLLVKSLHEKRITEGQDGKKKLIAHYLLFTLVLHKNCTRFQPLRRVVFFMHIIKAITLYSKLNIGTALNENCV